MPAWVKIAFIYVGTVIGAGFASGQEVYVFFTRFGSDSLKACWVSTLLFSSLGAFVLYSAHRTGVYDVLALIGQGEQKAVCALLNMLSTGVLLSNLTVMAAGSGALFEELLNMDYGTGVLIMLFSVGCVVAFGLKGLSRANTLIVPVILCIIAYIGMKSPAGAFSRPELLALKAKDWWLISALAYVCLNMATASVVLAGAARMLKRARDAIIGGLAGGAALGLCLFSVNRCVAGIDPVAGSVQMPVLEAALSLNGMGPAAFGLNLWLAMFTTAVSCGFALSSKITKRFKISNYCAAVVVSTAVMPLTMVGFAPLVRTLYPVFGFLMLAVALWFIFKRILHFVRELHII